MPRTKRVDADAAGPELACHAARHLEHGGFGGVVRDPGVVLSSCTVHHVSVTVRCQWVIVSVERLLNG